MCISADNYLVDRKAIPPDDAFFVATKTFFNALLFEYDSEGPCAAFGKIRLQIKRKAWLLQVATTSRRGLFSFVHCSTSKGGRWIKDSIWIKDKFLHHKFSCTLKLLLCLWKKFLSTRWGIFLYTFTVMYNLPMHYIYPSFEARLMQYVRPETFVIVLPCGCCNFSIFLHFLK